jgi:CheY-like chemotaxis protein/glycine cleavage system H lipoate-binding protein
MAERKRILVVDDEEVIRISVKKALKRDPFEIETESDAEKALDRLGSEPFDLVITDIIMGGLDGMALLEAIKRRSPDVLVAVITGYPSMQTAVQAHDLGACGYVHKPFTRHELRSVVIRALRQQEAPLVPQRFGDPEPGQTKHFFSNEQSWIRVEGPSLVQIGMARGFAEKVGEVAEVFLPNRHDWIEQGKMYGVIQPVDGEAQLLHAPLSGSVTEINPAINKNACLVGDEPEGDGWLLRLRPLNLHGELES